MAKGNILAAAALHEIVRVLAINRKTLVDKFFPSDGFVVQDLMPSLTAALVAIDLDEVLSHFWCRTGDSAAGAQHSTGTATEDRPDWPPLIG